MEELMKRLTTMVALAVAVSMGAAFAAPAGAAPPDRGALANLTDPTVRVQDTASNIITGAVNITDVNLPARTVTGTFTPVGGIADGVALPFVADITGILGPADPPGQCQILDLVLGPLNLDLLGLVVFLDTVHLNITAQQGPGNLLGNLLCAVAGLLDNT
jgi:hypothetical protein